MMQHCLWISNFIILFDLFLQERADALAAANADASMEVPNPASGFCTRPCCAELSDPVVGPSSPLHIEDPPVTPSPPSHIEDPPVTPSPPSSPSSFQPEIPLPTPPRPSPSLQEVQDQLNFARRIGGRGKGMLLLIYRCLSLIPCSLKIISTMHFSVLASLVV